MGDILSTIGDGLRFAFQMAWEVWWALILGFLLSGIVQGLGAELIFALFLYRRFGLPTAALAGVGAAAAAWIFEFFYGSSPNILKSLEFNAIYLGTLVVSGAVLAGVVGWLLVRALAASGALSRFAAGREHLREV